MGNVMTEEVRNLNPLDVLTYKYLISRAPESRLRPFLLALKAK